MVSNKKNEKVYGLCDTDGLVWEIASKQYMYKPEQCNTRKKNYCFIFSDFNEM